MQCPKCKKEVGKIKKYQVVICKCGVKLMCIEINKELILLNLRNNKEEK